MTAPLAILRPSVPDESALADIIALVARVGAEDGREPLSDQAMTQLGSPAVQHVLARDQGRLVGYGQLDGDSLELAAERGAIGAVLHGFRGRSLLVWSHGRHSRLVPELEARGFSRQRELYQLRRALSDDIDAPAVPDGVRLAPFVVGRDETHWLQVNAVAFATHPEQGRWTRADLDAREGEAWFDPNGFLLAWRGDELIGFHWTKVHPDGAGEVYVLAVAPAAQGLGLGAVLLLHGLKWLQQRGCPHVLLYVDADNTAAVHLYERYGFTRHDLDVQWRSAQSSTGSESNT